MDLVVYKLGGSLLSWNDLADHLNAVLELRGNGRSLIIVGGGAVTDIVRHWSDVYLLPQETAHWIAVQSLAINRALVRHLLIDSREVASRQSAEAEWKIRPGPLLLDVELYLREAEKNDHNPLPHHWNATSDSIAAWVASRWMADELVLLKSTDAPTTIDVEEAAHLGLIDPLFPELAAGLPQVHWCNLRSQPPIISAWFQNSQRLSNSTLAPPERSAEF
jgi:aspartokinase-like uncharacterized kinase